MVTTETVAVKYRAALLCVPCDLPAAHKVCGFMSHSKCKQYFPYDTDRSKIDYSGVMLCHQRLHSEQKMHGLESFKARSLADQEK